MVDGFPSRAAPLSDTVETTAELRRRLRRTIRHRRAGVVLDIEANTMITSVVSNGLPEVIREVGLDRNMNHVDWVSLVKTQISRAVAFYDTLFPEDPLGPGSCSGGVRCGATWQCRVRHDGYLAHLETDRRPG